MDLGYLPQDFGIYPNLKAVEFLAYLAARKGLNDQTAPLRSSIHCGGIWVLLTRLRAFVWGGGPGGGVAARMPAVYLEITAGLVVLAVTGRKRQLAT
jgi:hypothetical protein